MPNITHLLLEKHVPYNLTQIGYQNIDQDLVFHLVFIINPIVPNVSKFQSVMADTILTRLESLSVNSEDEVNTKLKIYHSRLLTGSISVYISRISSVGALY